MRPDQAIGCEGQWPNPNADQSDANNHLHYLYLPPSLTDTGKLLVLFGGGEGSAGNITTDIGPFAAGLGYHVIGLTYPAAPANSCGSVRCFGDALHEVVTGEERSPSAGGDKTSLGQHSQDSIANRLLRVLQWADENYPDDGWHRYLTDNNTAVNWSEIHIGGHSNGSSHSSYMGSLTQFQDIGRVSLFAGPDDGKGGEDEATWNSATYIQDAETDTATRYYGLVHDLNKARKLTTGEEIDPPAYQVYKNWNTFGMEGPYNQDRFDEFDPEPGYTPDFGNAHMLISIDPEREEANDTHRGTTKGEAHNSVVQNIYCIDEEEEEDGDVNNDGYPGDHHCEEYGDPVTMKIGYEPAWACILGSGDAYASGQPDAYAGPDQTVECQGNGGANVDLDGSGSTDPDCDILSYAWSGPFGAATERNPNVFCPVGTNRVWLVASDTWWSSLSDTTTVSVVDTTPPSLQVTLSPTTLWPANHRMVRIDATVIIADSCGGPSPQVVLTSITSDQPDNGTGDGDTANDIQDAQTGTFDVSFLLRAERSGGSPNGRTYTVTYTARDASGNQTENVTTVLVPHS
jgi:hypothetical protein